MLQTLGRNRIIVLTLLVLLNAAIGLGIYMYTMPTLETGNQSLEAAKSALEDKRNQIQSLKEEYALLQIQLRSFKEIEAKGFFNDQGRVEAQESFEKLRTISGVITAKYDIQAGQVIEDERAKDAGYVVLKSPIKVELDSMDDVDVYNFIKLIQERFPGKVDINKMKLVKKENITPEILKQIGSGHPTPMVNTEIEFEWKTMTAKDKMSADTTGASKSETPQDPSIIPPPQSMNAPPAEIQVKAQ